MSKGAKWFSEEEKSKLRELLCTECEKSWSMHGYKKTSIGELTRSVGISTGAFYTLYSSKEELFYRTILNVIERVKLTTNEIVSQQPTREGACKAIKYLFEEYSHNPFLYDFSSPDFWALINKLPEEQWEKIQADNVNYLTTIMSGANLKFKVEPQKAHAILATLMYTVTARDKIPYDNFEVFNFLVDCSFDKLFE